MQILAPSGQKTRLQSASLGITGVGVAIALLYYGREFWITLVSSVVLAFMLEPFVGLFLRLRVPRRIASLLTCGIAVLALYLIGVALVSQLASFADDIPVYSQRVNQLVDSVAEQIERAEREAYRLLIPRRFQEGSPPNEPQGSRRRPRQPVPPPVQEVRIREDHGGIVNYIASYVGSLYHALLMASFVPFLVYFMLSWREHIHRSLLSLYTAEDRVSASRSLRTIANMARAYVVGNMILGLLIAVVSCGIFWTWQLPYWILVGFISGFLSLVPYVGLPLALLPPLAAALMTYSALTPFLIITAEVAVLHLLALNLLYPAVVGARVHLNPLAVTVSLMFWGTIWGAVGLVLAIPMTAAIKAFLDNSDDLQGFGRLLGD